MKFLKTIKSCWFIAAFKGSRNFCRFSDVIQLLLRILVNLTNIFSKFPSNLRRKEIALCLYNQMLNELQ